MNNTQQDILIIGAGLTGLVLANLLETKGFKVGLVEARERLGGRIYTKYAANKAPVEMGATWLGKKHSALINLLKQLDIDIFEQILGNKAVYEPISTSPPQMVTLPKNSDPSFRIKGGSSILINKLAKNLKSTEIFTNQQVTAIEKKEEKMAVHTTDKIFESKYVVSTLPPFLLTSTIKFSPSLPENLLNIAQNTHTWMGESIKVSLLYQKAFWKAAHSSGTIFSNVGPIPEMYDQSNAADNLYALTGFFNGVYFSLSKEQRLEKVLTQLEKYYGTVVRDYSDYEEVVWRNEPFTFTPYYTHILPHQNNGNPIFQHPFLEGNFFVAGTETAKQYPGYMDGAIHSAHYVFERLAASISN